MSELNLPLHPSKRHPLTGEPLQAVYVDKLGRCRWPVMGGDGSNDGGTGGDSGGQGGAGGSNTDGDQGGNNGGSGGDTGGDDKGGNGDLGFPKDTPVAQMKPEEQAAYWRHQAKKHEGRATAYHQAVGGKSADDVKAELEAAAELRRQNQTEHERALEDARVQGKREASLSAARMALELATGHVAGDEKNDRSGVLDTLDMSKLLTEAGDVDTGKVRSLAAQLAPADKDQGTGRDLGGGPRGSTRTKTGVAAGSELFRASRKSKSES